MSEYLVRWKFGPNSLLNHMDHDTSWYQQFHSNKEDAVKHYISSLQNTRPSEAMTIELFELVQLVPGDNRNDVVRRGSYASPKQREARLERIKSMHEAGFSKSEIARNLGITSEYVRKLMHKHNLLVEPKE